MRDAMLYYNSHDRTWEFCYGRAGGLGAQVIASAHHLDQLGFKMPEHYGYARKCIAAGFLGAAFGKGFPWSES